MKWTSRSDLQKIARARLRDADVLYRAQRYDGAIYLCGYAVEIALKARICKALAWVPLDGRRISELPELPNSQSPCAPPSFGHRRKDQNNLDDRMVSGGSVGSRSTYKPTGSATRQAAELMIASARVLLRRYEANHRKTGFFRT